MNRVLVSLTGCIGLLLLLSFNEPRDDSRYAGQYEQKVRALISAQDELLRIAQSENGRETLLLRESLRRARLQLKAADFWLRYLEPVAYKKLNGPLPVEWETEVFEKFEVPYRRDGAGLTLAEQCLADPIPDVEHLRALIRASRTATEVFLADSITQQLRTYHHFFLSNRLFLMNLAAIYTTGFECPDRENILPELRFMLNSVDQINQAFNTSFPRQSLTAGYLTLFKEAIRYVEISDGGIDRFDHFEFIQRYVNPLFSMNQELIRKYHVMSVSYNDYSLNDAAASLFDKTLFEGLSAKGVYDAVYDESMLREIRQTGKLLFYDPVLSGNNQRSCASCHKPAEFFTDTTATASPHFNRKERLARNTPTLVNVIYNHLANADGKHFTLQAQAKDVISNPQEMAGDPEDVLQKVLSIGQYRSALKKFARLTPFSKTISLAHITSAISLYYGQFSRYYSPFDLAFTEQRPVQPDARNGFNLFMGKAGCGTCHFVPGFNGVKPPYTNSEFEVLGTPADPGKRGISPDIGRYGVHPVAETRNAFRTGTIRNIPYTAPYMHNGVFRSLDEVLEFYNTGGGRGAGLRVTNQTLPADSLKLTAQEKKQLIAFIYSLCEEIPAERPPESLPASSISSLNSRKPGGAY